MIRRSEKYCKEGVCLIQRRKFRRQHAFVHVSAIMHSLPEYRSTYIRGGGGYVLSGHCSRQQISVKNEGYLFSEGFLFTGFYGSSFKLSERKSVAQGILEIFSRPVLQNTSKLSPKVLVFTSPRSFFHNIRLFISKIFLPCPPSQKSQQPWKVF